MTYFWYKCRGCDQLFKSGACTMQVSDATSMMMKSIERIAVGLPLLAIHQCEPDKVGMADLQFARKEDR